MDKKQLLKIILGISTSSERVGTFDLALERARYFCGNINESLRFNRAEFHFRQDILEKCIEGNMPTQKQEIGDIFVAILLYLNCLEQLGLLFFLKKETDNGITCSLKYASEKGILNFTGSDKAISALTRLRHSLAHNYGLVSLPKKSQTTYYKYVLSFEENKNKILDMPKKEWEGDYGQKSDDSSVIVYVFPLIRKIEEMINTLKIEFEKGNLFCNMDENQLETRFTIKC